MIANIATGMALLGNRVCVVDTDLQSPGVHVLFGLDDEKIQYTLNDYLWGKCSVRETVYNVSNVLDESSMAIDKERSQLYLMPSSMKSEDIATILSDGYDVELLQEGFYEISEQLQLDYLFIDTHPGMNEETLLAIGLSDTFVLILRPDQQDYLGTAVMVEVAEQLEVPQMLLVVNKVISEFNVPQLKKKVEQTYDKPVAGILPLSNEMLRLGSEGLFCLRYPDHPLSGELKKVVKEIKG